MSGPELRIALRADASLAIGLGHVKRCIALAAALRELGAHVRLVARDLGVDVTALARGAGLEVVVLPAPATFLTSADEVAHAHWAGTSWQQDAADTVSALEAWRTDAIVVDHYAFDARWHREVAQRLGTRITVIDDLADRNLDADILLDQNPGSDHCAKYAGRLAARTIVLGGPRFALLAPVYAAAKPAPVRVHVASIGIFMGGIDASDLSSLALRACREHARFAGRIEIAATRANPHATSLAQLTRRWPDTTLSLDLPDLAQFFARHDLQIGAGGGATWERCRLGAPTLALVAAENQRAVLPQLAQAGAVALYDGELAPASLGAAVAALLSNPAYRQSLAQRARALVDGLGARRVALRMAGDRLVVRPASVQDAQMMLSWRNHPATRAVSTNSAPIAWDDHVGWVQRTTADPRRCLLIGRAGSLDVGVIRFDLAADGTAEVSLYLDPAFHGLGLGPRLLLAGEAHALQRLPDIARFKAIVLQENLGSQRMFQSCGYHSRRGTWSKDAR